MAAILKFLAYIIAYPIATQLIFGNVLGRTPSNEYIFTSTVFLGVPLYLVAISMSKLFFDERRVTSVFIYGIIATLLYLTMTLLPDGKPYAPLNTPFEFHSLTIWVCLTTVFFACLAIREFAGVITGQAAY